MSRKAAAKSSPPRNASAAEPSSGEPEIASNERFRKVLKAHLDRLGWSVDALCNGSKDYPERFDHSISLSHMYGVMSGTQTSSRRVTRGMVNLIAHTLCAHYEDPEQAERARRDRRDWAHGFSRRNLEAVLHELLEAAGYGPLVTTGDRWWEIMGEYHNLNEAPPIRVGYLRDWGEFTDRDFSTSCPSRQFVSQLLNLLGIRGEVQKVPIKLEDLYSERLFRDIDLLAPAISIPARRYTVATSRPIGRWQVGQTALCASNINFNPLPPSIDLKGLLEQGEWWRRLEVHLVSGGITEMFLGMVKQHLDREHIHRHDTFRDAIDAAIARPHALGHVAGQRIPVLLCDGITAKRVEKEEHARALITHGGIIARPLAVGLPPARPEVVEMVNDALAMMEGLELIEINQQRLEYLGITLAPEEPKKLRKS